MEVDQELVEKFKKLEFIYYPNFLSKDEVLKARGEVESLIQNIEEIPTEAVFYDDKKDVNSLKQIQKLFNHRDYFRSMMFESKFQKLAESLLESKVRGENMQYFNKPPKSSLPTPPHQDGYYFMLKPNHAITMWLALEEVDEENGCVKYIKGSNHLGMRYHSKTNTLGFSQGIADFGEQETDNAVFYTPLNPGDLLAHHSLTIHFADKNNSVDRQRRGLGFIYYSKDAEIDKLAYEKYQTELENELKREGKL